MLTNKTIRAWKDPRFRKSLSEKELSLLPENPAGTIELSDSDLKNAIAGDVSGTASCWWTCYNEKGLEIFCHED